MLIKKYLCNIWLYVRKDNEFLIELYKYTSEKFEKPRLNQGHDVSFFHRFIVLLPCDKCRVVGYNIKSVKRLIGNGALSSTKWCGKFIAAVIIWTPQWLWCSSMHALDLKRFGFYLEGSIWKVYTRGSQLISMAGHEGPKIVQRHMSDSQMNTIALCVSMYLKVDKGSDQEWLAGRIWPTGCLLRTPGLYWH